MSNKRRIFGNNLSGKPNCGDLGVDAPVIFGADFN
jgi:hypothetical protein